MTSDGRAGNCTDCGKAVWWQDNELVDREGRQWCFRPDLNRTGMEQHHALPGMPQFVVQSSAGNSLSDRDALDQIAQILRLHAGAGHVAAIAQVVQRTGRVTRAQDLG